MELYLDHIRRVVTLSFICLPLMAQISVPRIGTVRYQDGSFHTVQGLPANMIVADLPLDGAEAASFSDSGGLISQNGVIRLLAPDFSLISEYQAGPVKPLLAIEGELTSALAWLPATYTLLHWNGAEFASFSLPDADLDGKVTDVQYFNPKQARLIVQHANDTVSAITVSLRNGNLISSEILPGVQGYAVSHGYFMVYTAEKELIADNLRGYRRSVPLPAPDIAIERMSNQWLHLYSPSLRQSWALHITQADLQLSMLPGLPGLASQGRTGIAAAETARRVK